MDATSRYVNAFISADTVALNAAIFGFSGHSIVTPHAAIQQNWWTDERIEARVTPDFVSSKLRPENRARLRQSPDSAGDLTDELYIDWILTRARRLFLVLVECRAADQIFGVIEDAWNDDDLPIALEDVSRLSLSKKPSEKLDREFYAAQFHFLLRPPQKGQHIDYGKDEVIALDYVYRLPPAAAIQHWLRVHLPRQSDTEYVQRKILLGKEEIDERFLAAFQADVLATRSVRCPHLAPVWATYTSEKSVFVMTDFVSEHTLKSFIDFRNPASFAKLNHEERTLILLRWLHCLSSAVASLHQQGFSHSAISPNNIVIDKDNQIAFTDIGSLKTLQTDKKRDADEDYNYGAPERIVDSQRVLSPEPNAPIRAGTDVASPTRRFFVRKKQSIASLFSVESPTVATDGSASSAASIMSAELPPPRIFDRPADRSSKGTTTTWGSDDAERSGSNSISEPQNSSSKRSSRHSDMLSLAETAKLADVYSLACIFLDVLTFAAKHRPYGDFIKHRASRFRTSRWKPAVVDNSFHANYPRVLTWMDLLETETYAFEQTVFRTFPRLMELVREMMQQDPSARPSASAVRDQLADILVGHGKMELHCGEESLPVVMEAQEAEQVVNAEEEATRLHESSIRQTNALQLLRHSSQTEEYAPLPDVICYSTLDPAMDDLTRTESANRWSAHVSERFHSMISDIGRLSLVQEDQASNVRPARTSEDNASIRRSRRFNPSHVKERLKAALPDVAQRAFAPNDRDSAPAAPPVPPRSPLRDLQVNLPVLSPITLEESKSPNAKSSTSPRHVESLDPPARSPLRGDGLLQIDFPDTNLGIPGLATGNSPPLLRKGNSNDQRKRVQSLPATLLPDPRDPRNNMRKRKDLEYPSPHPPDYFSYRQTVDGYGLYKRTLREFDVLVGYDEDDYCTDGAKQTLRQLDLVGEFYGEDVSV